MVIEGREKETLIFESAEELLQEIERLQGVLKSASGRNQPGKTQAQEWADGMDCNINRAFSLVKLQKRYPELKDVFAELDASARRADEDLFNYGIKMKLPKYI